MKLKLMTLIFGAVMMALIGATSVSASDSKCGAGKCGEKM